MRQPPLERVRERVRALGVPLCLGVDPHPDQLPHALPRTLGGVEAFARGLIEAVAPHVVAVKINLAFFEAYGPPGWAALERVRRTVPDEAVCIGDAKRGDIGSTAERYAAGLLGVLGFDGVTLSPYLGEDAIEPFLAYEGRLAYVLARTSNRSARTFQDRSLDGAPLHLRVVEWAAERWQDGRVGLVVGATAPAELERLRAAVPGPAFLVPGVGAQGGDLAAAVRACHGSWAPGLVSVSRGIAGASLGRGEWQTAAATAAESLARRMRGAVVHSSASAAHGDERGGS